MRALAAQYSGFVAGKPLPTLLRITTGAVDRGACISELSQYPGEVRPDPSPAAWPTLFEL